ncbi:FHA domain-containing protein [Fontisphaera persica]|uniref:FHA domain-containing protein n=1 Tax=Fontisphaera persica TaxID=2974023 RepID=UPI0024BFEAF0|nr:FHA domain-containing protein [Fontisphaera persica]WCJ60439.1 FHA domain-containing protein [Fontisphaera persica]
MTATPPAGGKESVWIEAQDGRRWSVLGSCGIGRSLTNQVVLEGAKVSRRHALVHVQSKNEHWLVDLASSNGTFLNGQRIAQPMLLRDGDRIGVGEYELIFHQPTGTAEAAQPPANAPFHAVRLDEGWLLLAEVLDATMIMQNLPPAQQAQVMERWMEEGRNIVRRHHGVLNQYLGDGFLAFWKEDEQTTASVAQCIKELLELQAKAEPPFRFVVHHGQVAFGISAVTGDETLMGQEVNRLFRMEKLAGAQGQSTLLSTPARERLQPFIETFEIGTFTLLGFRQAETFYAF